MYSTHLQVATLCLCWLHVTSIFIPAGTYVFPREQLVFEYLRARQTGASLNNTIATQQHDTFTPLRQAFARSVLRVGGGREQFYIQEPVSLMQQDTLVNHAIQQRRDNMNLWSIARVIFKALTTKPRDSNKVFRCANCP